MEEKTKKTHLSAINQPDPEGAGSQPPSVEVSRLQVAEG